MARLRNCGGRRAPAIPAWRIRSWRWWPRERNRELTSAPRRREPAGQDRLVRAPRNAAGGARLAVADDRRQPPADPHRGARLRGVRVDFAWHGLADAVFFR